ncbi:MAG TPA: PadR family transcriptional regulator [Acidimicrobiales bacterium]|nr:PadR family transcriptional regulator [Acidimicrobiales bacterium]
MSVPDGLLVLLREDAKHGYQLASDFADRTAGRWTLNTGQVYTTLDRLARDGFVEEDGTDPTDERRRRVRLTPAGRDRAEAWLTTTPDTTATRDELVLRILLSAAADPRAALDLVTGQRAELVARLQARRRDQRAAGSDLLPRMAADAGAVRIEAELRWLDLCEERLHAHLRESRPPTPAPLPDPSEDR